LTTVSTAPLTSLFPSLVLVCPSNWGLRTFTESTAVSPSRTSSPESASRPPFLKRPALRAYSLMVRVSAALNPVRCVPPSWVLMLLTKVKVFSL
jgi:hypothetical protein